MSHQKWGRGYLHLSTPGGFSIVQTSHAFARASMTLDWKYTLDWYIPVDEGEEKSVKDVIISVLESHNEPNLPEAAESLDRVVKKLGEGTPYGVAGILEQWLQDIFIHMASVANYETDAQDRLVELMLTLQRLPEQQGRQYCCLLYTSPSPRDGLLSRMPSSA